jgi:glutamine amidotransferase
MSKKDALLIDAGTGNLHSVYNALRRLGFDILVTSDPADLARSGRVILPGVGAFANFMEGLVERRLVEPLSRAAQSGDPLLGICVGMQALFDASEEMGEHGGLGLVPGRVVHFPELGNLKVPHTGWNQLWSKALPPDPLLSGLPAWAYAYFNHSYYCSPASEEDTSAVTDYGISFASLVRSANLYGVQFHPEKSQRVGLQILDNFMRL